MKLDSQIITYREDQQRFNPWKPIVWMLLPVFAGMLVTGFING